MTLPGGTHSDARQPEIPPGSQPGGLTSQSGRGSTFAKGSWRGTMAAPPVATIVGAVLAGRYRILRLIASGGMGSVYEAHDDYLERHVALKTIHLGQEVTPEAVERFRREALASAQLDHPNIVAVYDICEDDGLRFFTMALVEGQSLSQLVRDRGPLSPCEAVRVMLPIVDAIEYAHKHQLIHRDLKPENVLLDSLGRPRVLDFGLARHLLRPGDLTATNQLLGTPRYMAPEQARNRHDLIGPATDVYALGGVLGFLLSGKSPVTGDSLMDILLNLIEGSPSLPRDTDERVPEALNDICRRCLAREPEDRFASAEDLGAALRAFADFPATVETVVVDSPILPPAIPAAPERRSRRARWAFAGLVGIASVVGLVVARDFRDTPDVPTRSTVAEAVVPKRKMSAELVTTPVRAPQMSPEIQGPRPRIERQSPFEPLRDFPKESLVRASASVEPGPPPRAIAVAVAVVEPIPIPPPVKPKPDLESEAIPFLPRVKVAIRPIAVVVPEPAKPLKPAEIREVGLKAAPGSTRVMFLPDGDTLLSWNAAGTIERWDLKTSRPLPAMAESAGPIASLVVDRNGCVAVAFGNGGVSVWNREGKSRELVSFEAAAKHPTALAFHPDGGRIAVGDSTGRLIVHEARNGKVIWSFAGHTKPIEDSTLLYSPDGKWLVSGSADRTLRVWDAETGKPVCSLSELGRVSSLRFAPDSRSLIFVDIYGLGPCYQKRLELPSGKVASAKVAASGSIPVGLDFILDGKIAMAASRQGAGYTWLWNMKDGNPGEIREGISTSGFRVLPSRDRLVSVQGTRLVAYELKSERGTVQIRKLRAVQEHSAEIAGLAVSPDGRVAATADAKGNLRIWDVKRLMLSD